MEQSEDKPDLEDFIRSRMKMSHVYQPVMIQTLLEHGGAASLEEIAQALLRYDVPQVEYYAIRTKAMVGKVLTQNGVVEAVKDGNKIVGYRLIDDDLSDRRRASLTAMCRERLNDYINKRGAAIWGHRSLSDGYVSRSTRYEVLNRAKHRCELCGAHETQAALHVDHIVPRAKGGSDELSNFQALCISCNTSKRDRDDTDFREVLASYDHRDSGCLFCDVNGRVKVSQMAAQNVATLGLARLPRE